MKDLNKRMAEATKAARPSMVPDFKPPVASKESTPDISQVIQDPVDRARLSLLITKSDTFRQEIKDLEASRRPYTDEIKRLLTKHRVSNCLCSGVPVTFFTVVRTSLNKAKLMARGVTEEIIAECMDQKDIPTLRIGGTEREDG